MKIVCISDTHGQHKGLLLPEGDVLVHAGDISGRGERSQVLNFLDWFADQPYRHKVFIAGNHDWFFERYPHEVPAVIPAGVTYLNDSGVEIEGLRLWGSPVQPWFLDWAFNRQRGEEIRRHWELIPEGIDLLITHGPAFGKVDQTIRGQAVGCEDLRDAIKRTKPRVHLSGHIHEAYGVAQDEHTLYVNASVMDVRYRRVHPPVVLELGDEGLEVVAGG